jgi:Arc/MetJ-type ribon-helix-helix transcriptional regulator
MPARHSKIIILTPELDHRVEAGARNSVSEVVRDGLRTPCEREEHHAAELDAIRLRLGVSLDQADRGEYARGVGEQTVRRAFKTGLKKARTGCGDEA